MHHVLVKMDAGISYFRFTTPTCNRCVLLAKSVPAKQFVAWKHGNISHKFQLNSSSKLTPSPKNIKHKQALQTAPFLEGFRPLPQWVERTHSRCQPNNFVGDSELLTTFRTTAPKESDYQELGYTFGLMGRIVALPIEGISVICLKVTFPNMCTLCLYVYTVVYKCIWLFIYIVFVCI